jgi:transposase
MKSQDRYTQDHLHRWHVLQMAIDGHITLLEASTRLGISYRQAKRLKSAVVRGGLAGLQHGNRGKRSSRAINDHERTRILHLARTQYADLNDTRLTERLKSEHGIGLSRETIRKILRSGGIKSAAAGSGDMRLPCYTSQGMMVLWGGIEKKWFGDTTSCFMAAVDTATLRCLAARFFTAQTTEGYLWLMRTIAQSYGLPRAFCQHSGSAVRRRDSSWTLEEELRGERDPSQVERALQALGIPHYLESKRRIMSIPALFESFLAGQFEGREIADIKSANSLLEQGVIAAFNRSHACPPVNRESVWLPVPPGAAIERICSFFYAAIVQPDNKIVLGEMTIDVPPGKQRISYARTPVEVRQLLDGSWRVYYQNDIIAPHGPTPVREPVPSRSPRHRSKQGAAIGWVYAMLEHGSGCD